MTISPQEIAAGVILLAAVGVLFWRKSGTNSASPVAAAPLMMTAPAPGANVIDLEAIERRAKEAATQRICDRVIEARAAEHVTAVVGAMAEPAK